MNPSWGQRQAEAALAAGAAPLAALQLGLPYADELLACKALRRLPEGDREDALQEVWIEALAEPGPVAHQLRAYLLALAGRTAARGGRQRKREAKRGRAWEEARRRGENQWP